MPHDVVERAVANGFHIPIKGAGLNGAAVWWAPTWRSRRTRPGQTWSAGDHR
jgi:hypothetical protein